MDTLTFFEKKYNDFEGLSFFSMPSFPESELGIEGLRFSESDLQELVEMVFPTEAPKKAPRRPRKSKSIAPYTVKEEIKDPICSALEELREFVDIQPKRKIKCPHCDMAFSRVCYLSQHVRTHDTNPFKCSKCGKRFENEQKLNTHVLQHEVTNKPHPCLYCEKAYAHPADLRAHMSKHHFGTTKHNCHLCDKRFTRPDHLKRHLATHEHQLKEEHIEYYC